jgi:hypothetical protein
MTSKTVTYAAAGYTINQDPYASLSDCKKDDITQYNSDGSWNVDEGSSTCTPSAPQTIPMGSWSIDESTNMMSLVAGTGSVSNLTISELNGSTLKTTQTESLPLAGLGSILTLLLGGTAPPVGVPLPTDASITTVSTYTRQ